MAAESLKNWTGYSFEMKVGPIGVLVLDEKGHIKEHKLGPRATGTGAGIGLVLAVIAPPSLLVGLVGGGAIGHFRHKGLGLDQADRDRIVAELAGGKAAVGVMALPKQAQVISETLADLRRHARGLRRVRRGPRGGRERGSGRRLGRRERGHGPDRLTGQPGRSTISIDLEPPTTSMLRRSVALDQPRDSTATSPPFLPWAVPSRPTDVGTALDAQPDGGARRALEADRPRPADEPDRDVADRTGRARAGCGRCRPSARIGGRSRSRRSASTRLTPPTTSIVHGIDGVERDRGGPLAPVERDAAVLDEHAPVAHADLRGRAVELAAVEVGRRAARSGAGGPGRPTGTSRRAAVSPPSGAAYSDGPVGSDRVAFGRRSRRRVASVWVRSAIRVRKSLITASCSAE